jgi:hypothetical protein
MPLDHKHGSAASGAKLHCPMARMSCKSMGQKRTPYAVYTKHVQQIHDPQRRLGIIGCNCRVQQRPKHTPFFVCRISDRLIDNVHVRSAMEQDELPAVFFNANVAAEFMVSIDSRCIFKNRRI